MEDLGKNIFLTAAEPGYVSTYCVGFHPDTQFSTTHTHTLVNALYTIVSDFKIRLVFPLPILQPS
jgi:hypothetical protein